MNPDAQKALIFELADALLRSWWTLIGGICFGIAAAVLVLGQIPKQYDATAKILVKAQSVPKDLVRTTVTEDMTQRILVLKAAVLSDFYMKELVDRTFGTPANEADLEALIRRVRSRITVKPATIGNQTILAFDLTFRGTDPQRAALVVNTLAELYIAQNTEFRSNQAQDTTEAIEDRTSKARRDYEAAEQALIDFKAKHRFETEAYLETNLRQLELAKRDLDNNLETKARIPERIRVLESQLAEIENEESVETRIAQLEAELDELLLRYSDVHPDVLKKRRQIDEVKQNGESIEPQTQSDATQEPLVVSDDPERTAIEGEISRLRRELSDLESGAAGLRREVAEYNRRIRAVPEVQPRLTALQNERDNLDERYQDQRDKLERAEESQDMEEKQRGQQFELAERARVPLQPAVPKPAPAFVLGLAAGCLLFVGPLLVRRFLNPMISSESGLRALTDVPVLVTIPRILTPSYRGATTRRFMKNLSISAVFVVSLVAVFLMVN